MPQRIIRFSLARGFSIVELLVAISIIAVLLALLLPTLTSARAVALSSVCAGNLRQVYIGFSNYAGENNDHFPAIGGAGGAARTWWNVLGNAGYFGGPEYPAIAPPSTRKERWRVSAARPRPAHSGA